MEIRIGEAVLELSLNGRITGLSFPEASACSEKQERPEKSVFPEGKPSFLIRLFRNGKPEKIRLVEQRDGQLIWHFENMPETVVLNVEEKPGYTVFEVAECPEAFEYLTVGPIVTALNDTVGDVVGVVQGEDKAIGIQALNRRLLSGIPEALKPEALYQKDTATSEPTVCALTWDMVTAFDQPFGSVLHLFAENRRRDRVKSVLYAKDCIPAPALDDPEADIKGAKFALFGCGRTEALSVIGTIEQGEGLPHPELDGEWLKISRKAMTSYLIGEFGTQNLDKMLDYARMGGFSWLYHPEPFDTWGHFELRKEQFPDGDASMKECVERAAKKGVSLGLHTLTNFTTTNDAYVTPVPDPRLKKMIPVRLLESVDEKQPEIRVDRAGGFLYEATLNCFQIGDELLQYSSCEQEGEGLVLKDCVRGAFGTLPAAHKAGENMYKMTDYPYQTLFPDIELQDAFADRIAELFNRTGLKQISLDGQEGCEWTGEGKYAVYRFASRCYEKFDHTVLNDASRLHHFLWHQNTRMNWGEPWGEEMRTGQVEGRLRNQAFFKKNLFPAMLGWFLIRKANRRFEASTLMDMEWALSEAAGFDAGFALSASENTLDGLGSTREILEAIKNWERLRMGNCFPEALKEELRKPETEWHLEKEDEETYSLYPMAISKPFICDLLEMQPGQPGGSDWSFTNPFEEQELVFRMRVEGYGYIENPRFYTRLGMIRFDARVKGGQYLIFDGKEAYVTDRNYNRVGTAGYSGSCRLAKGTAALSFGCSFGGEEGPEVRVRVMTKTQPYTIRTDESL